MEDVGGTWKAGDTLSFNTFIILPCGLFGNAMLYFSIFTGKPITATKATVKTLVGNVRINGTTIIGANTNLLANNTQTVNIIKEPGIITVCLTFSSGFDSNLMNSAAVLAINKAEIVFS